MFQLGRPILLIQGCVKRPKNGFWVNLLEHMKRWCLGYANSILNEQCMYMNIGVFYLFLLIQNVDITITWIKFAKRKSNTNNHHKAIVALPLRMFHSASSRINENWIGTQQNNWNGYMCSRLPIEVTLDGWIPKKGTRCWWAETHNETAQTAELQITMSVCAFILNNRSYLTRSISDTVQKRSRDPAFLDPYVSTSRS